MVRIYRLPDLSVGGVSYVLWPWVASDMRGRFGIGYSPAEAIREMLSSPDLHS